MPAQPTDPVDPSLPLLRRPRLRDGGHDDNRIAALLIAGLLAIGAGLGSVNLVVDGVLRPGTPYLAYGASMALLLVLAVLLVLRGRVDRTTVFGLVLTGDVVYVVVSVSVVDAVLYAPPLMMLFAAFAAAWYLDRLRFALHLAIVPVACWIALAPSFPDLRILAVQVVVNASMLDVASIGVFVLHRRVQRLLAETELLSSTDPLTGLANRRSLAAGADRLWRQAHRDGEAVAAFVLDLDHFKQLNDEHGHAAGDAVLQEVAAALAGIVRPSDLLARTGGEEMVVLGMVKNHHEAQLLGQRLRAAVGTASRPEYPVTASVGLALSNPTGGEDSAAEVRRLIDRADLAMYEAKQRGRDRLHVA